MKEILRIEKFHKLQPNHRRNIQVLMSALNNPPKLTVFLRKAFLFLNKSTSQWYALLPG